MVSDEPTFLNRFRRQPPAPTRPDYKDPDFSSWAAKLDAFVDTTPPTAPAPPTAPTTAAAVATPKDSAVDVKGKPSSLNLVLEKMLDFDGAMCAALADSESGMVLGQAGSGIDMERAAASASMVLRARRATVKALAIPDQIDDLLVTLTTQLHIIRPLAKAPTMFIYIVADRSKASLAMGRYKANEAEANIDL